MVSRKKELLVPAGSLEVLKVALRYGADAVYIGGEAYGLRAKARNFTREEMAEGIRIAHEAGARVYVTVNIIAHNADLPGIRAYLEELAGLGPDALIIADPGVFSLAKEICPGIPVHISTQANNTNTETARFWHRLGASRIVTARELSLEEIRAMRAGIPEDMEIETFVHGAMCISYSGRCLLSSFLAGRDSNRGECSHPCRWKYSLVEETRPGEYMPVAENERGTFIFNSTDLCMVDRMDDLLASGIDSFKIEGRMKNALYVATTARSYRLAIDACTKDPAGYAAQLDWFRTQIRACTTRPFSTGFFYGKPGREGQIYTDSTYLQEYVYLGCPDSAAPDGELSLIQKNKFSVGETIEIMKPDGRNIEAGVLSIRDEAGQPMESAPHAAQRIHVRLSAAAEPYDILRRRS